jgi:hypothetical protein
MGDNCMSPLLLLRRAPQRSDLAYESVGKDVWFDHGDLMDLDLTSDFDCEDRSYD